MENPNNAGKVLFWTSQRDLRVSCLSPVSFWLPPTWTTPLRRELFHFPKGDNSSLCVYVPRARESYTASCIPIRSHFPLEEWKASSFPAGPQSRDWLGGVQCVRVAELRQAESCVQQRYKPAAGLPEVIATHAWGGGGKGVLDQPLKVVYPLAGRSSARCSWAALLEPPCCPAPSRASKAFPSYPCDGPPAWGRPSPQVWLPWRRSPCASR